MSNLPPPPQHLVDEVVQSCQSLSEAAKQHVPVRGEAGAKSWGIVVGPTNLPPLSGRPPQQIEPPAGRHGAAVAPCWGHTCHKAQIPTCTQTCTRTLTCACIRCMPA
ncbi:hypothetical protein AMECASPLE_027229 [Ameca splendens]|uniref:Uncharacterized protein n=1 Tax=Ameca splendens TaxID=208324 RepID=A0ABV0Z312_9TELE